jgi:hypothetical protein
LADAYQLQSPEFLGNVGRNTLRGPHTNVFDLALMRDFPIHESIGLQFRWEVFNLTNTVQFGQPSNNVSSSSARRNNVPRGRSAGHAVCAAPWRFETQEAGNLQKRHSFSNLLFLEYSIYITFR